jgi:hypothetical protein
MTEENKTTSSIGRYSQNTNYKGSNYNLTYGKSIQKRATKIRKAWSPKIADQNIESKYIKTFNQVIRVHLKCKWVKNDSKENINSFVVSN